MDIRLKNSKLDSLSSEIKTNVMAKEFQKTTSANAVYGIGLIGAAIYYISTATSFGMGVLGVLKALVWPAFLVFEALKSLAAT
jgi:hypothetical protein